MNEITADFTVNILAFHGQQSNKTHIEERPRESVKNPKRNQKIF